MTSHKFNKHTIVKVLVVMGVNHHLVIDGMLLELNDKHHRIVVVETILINVVVVVVQVVIRVLILIEMVVIILVDMEDNVIIIMVDVIMSLIDHIIHMLVANQAIQSALIGIHHYHQILVLKGNYSNKKNKRKDFCLYL